MNPPMILWEWIKKLQYFIFLAKIISQVVFERCFLTSPGLLSSVSLQVGARIYMPGAATMIKSMKYAGWFCG